MATLNANACTDADEIREIIDTDLTEAQINAFLNMAYTTTLALVGNLGACGGSTMLCEIQKLLAAHFITLRERQTKSESIGGEWSVSYTAPESAGLGASLYGQQAMALDCSGILVKAGLKKATFHVTNYGVLEDVDLPEDSS